MMTPHPLSRTSGRFVVPLILASFFLLAGCGLQPSARVVQPVGPALSGSQLVPQADAPIAVAAAATPIGSLEVEAANLGFVDQVMTVAVPGLYRVHLINHDDVAHEIIFDDGTRLPAAAGEEVSALVTIPAAGSSFLCTIPAHRAAGMVGQIMVRDLEDNVTAMHASGTP